MIIRVLSEDERIGKEKVVEKEPVDHKTPRKAGNRDHQRDDCGDSPKQVQRYISLTKLMPEMLQELPGAGQFILAMDTWFEKLMAE